jgi:anti-sigma factor RsiW
VTCRALVDFLLDYLAGHLPAAQHAAFEAHLGGCPDCVAYLHGYREAVRLGRTALGDADGPPPGDVPDALVGAVMDAVRRNPR